MLATARCQTGWRLRSSSRANALPQAAPGPGVTGGRSEGQSKTHAAVAEHVAQTERASARNSAFSEAPCVLGPLSYNPVYYMTDLWGQG